MSRRSPSLQRPRMEGIRFQLELEPRVCGMVRVLRQRRGGNRDSGFDFTPSMTDYQTWYIDQEDRAPPGPLAAQRPRLSAGEANAAACPSLAIGADFPLGVESQLPWLGFSFEENGLGACSSDVEPLRAARWSAGARPAWTYPFRANRSSRCKCYRLLQTFVIRLLSRPERFKS